MQSLVICYRVYKVDESYYFMNITLYMIHDDDGFAVSAWLYENVCKCACLCAMFSE